LQRHDALGIFDGKLRHAHGGFHILAIQFAELFNLGYHEISPVVIYLAESMYHHWLVLI
jgi:hypothetical protein